MIKNLKSFLVSVLILIGSSNISFAEEIYEIVTIDDIEYVIVDGEYVPIDSLEIVQQEFSFETELSIGSNYLIENIPGSTWSTTDPSMYTVSTEGNYTKLTMIKPGHLVVYQEDPYSKGTINITVESLPEEPDYGSIEYKNQLIADVASSVNSERVKKGFSQCNYSPFLSEIADKMVNESYLHDKTKKNGSASSKFTSFSEYNLGPNAVWMFAIYSRVRDVIETFKQKWKDNLYKDGVTEIGVGYMYKSEENNEGKWCETIVILR